MARFERSELSKLRSTRRSIERRISKAQWRMEHDPSADLARLSTRIDEMCDDASELTLSIAVELHADERRTLRQALLQSN